MTNTANPSLSAAITTPQETTRVQIQPVQTPGDLKTFIDLPWKILGKYPEWVAPLKLSVKETLDQKNNPFYKRADIQLYLAYSPQGEPVGRIAAIANRAHNEHHKDQVGFYGFFDCIEDPQVSQSLFRQAESWLKQRGFTSMRGPMNPSTNHECGLLVEGYDQHPTLMTTWNPPYYAELHEKAGFQKAKDLVAYKIFRELISNLPKKALERTEKLKEQAGIQFRSFDVKNFEREVGICFDIYNSAWEENWGFFPMTREEFFFAAKDMKAIMDPKIAFIVEKDGQPGGFMVALPDLNEVLKNNKSGKLFPFGIFRILFGKKKIRSVRIITLGVKKEFRGGGIFGLFTHEAFKRAYEAGYDFGEASWILEDNLAMNTPWQKIGAPVNRKWRIYEKTFN